MVKARRVHPYPAALLHQFVSIVEPAVWGQGNVAMGRQHYLDFHPTSGCCCQRLFECPAQCKVGIYNLDAVLGIVDGIEVELGVDYLEKKEYYDSLGEKMVYTGPIDAYFAYALGTLEYRSVRFETEVLDKPNFQGNAAVNYTDAETPWTRIIEHKWFEFGKDENGQELPKTVISREYSSEWKPGDEPYYPVNDEKNGTLYEEYKKLAEKENDVIFGGRLGEYKYYDMDAVIAAALDMSERELG